MENLGGALQTANGERYIIIDLRHLSFFCYHGTSDPNTPQGGAAAPQGGSGSGTSALAPAPGQMPGGMPGYPGYPYPHMHPHMYWQQQYMCPPYGYK
eukprot:scaffold7980_cov88-Skeletonema_menzelii.AAC.3